MKRLLLLALVGAVLLNAAPALSDGDFYVVAVGKRTEGVGTKITSLPHTISNPGFYYLGGNLTTSETGITVNASDVTLDLMGFCITGPGVGVNAASGITIMEDCSNVEIRNGSLKGFSQYGIYAPSSSTGIRLIGIRVKETASCGIKLSGAGNLVMGCSVMNAKWDGMDIGPSSLVKGNYVTQTDWSAIIADVGSNVLGNVTTSNGIGIRAYLGTSVMDNTVFGNTSNGIYLGSFCTITRNTASNNGDAGIYAVYYCTITNNTTDGLTYNNGCTLANNTVTP